MKYMYIKTSKSRFRSILNYSNNVEQRIVIIGFTQKGKQVIETQINSKKGYRKQKILAEIPLYYF